jgi:hypothetical protein
MENDNDVTADSSTAGDGATQTSKQVPVENRVAELSRKTEKKLNDLASKLDQLVSYVDSQRAPKTTINLDADIDPKAYVDARVNQVYKEQIKEKQKESWAKALEIYPELDPENELYDEKFFKLADREFSRYREDDIESPLTAAESAARKLGLYEKRKDEHYRRDDSRRSRILGEGGSSSKETKKEQAPKMNASLLKRFFNIDAKKLEQRIKSDPNRYGKGD